MLIEKTVAQKEEFKSPDYQKYLDKIEQITKEEQKEIKHIDLDSELNIEKKDVFFKFNNSQNLIVDILFIVSKAGLTKEYDFENELETKISELNFIFSTINDVNFAKIKAQLKILSIAVIKFKNSQNKPFEFLEVNNATIALIEAIYEFVKAENLEKKDYYEIVENMLDKRSEENMQIAEKTSIVQHIKLDEILEKLPLLELKSEFLNEMSSA